FLHTYCVLFQLTPTCAIYTLSLHDALPICFAETCVFAKQSLGPFLCDSCLHESPFSRSYGVILPSSLTTVFSRVLIFSTHPPVSDRKSTRLNSSHVKISYAVFCLKKKKKQR